MVINQVKLSEYSIRGVIAENSLSGYTPFSYKVYIKRIYNSELESETVMELKGSSTYRKRLVSRKQSEHSAPERKQ